jgi:hypothetical protein
MGAVATHTEPQEAASLERGGMLDGSPPLPSPSATVTISFIRRCGLLQVLSSC